VLRLELRREGVKIDGRGQKLVETRDVEWERESALLRDVYL